ncbi:MAG: CBS domain-containing protein [Thermoplasmata archaeon]
MAMNWPSARDLMTPKPITLPPDAQLSSALGVMRSKRIHEIPVLRSGKLAGMITIESIARRSNLPLSTKVEHIMILPPIVGPTTTYLELAQHLLAGGMRAAVVVGKRGEVSGIVSRTDMVRALPSIEELTDRRAEEVMSPTGPTVTERESVRTLFAQIRALEEHPLPVVDGRGRLTGAVGISDLGRVLWKPTVGGKRDARTRGTSGEVEVRSIMTSPAVTAPKGTSIGAVARLMARQKVSSIFVVDDARPIGVVSQADLLGLAIGIHPTEGAELKDVYVQVHGLRGSTDPEIFTEVDRLVARGLRHVARHVRPVMLSLHISPQGTHRSGDASVAVRLYTDRGIYYSSVTSWNFFAGISDAMDDIAEQARRQRDGARQRGRASSRRVLVDDELVDPELEARIRSATQADEE